VRTVRGVRGRGRDESVSHISWRRPGCGSANEDGTALEFFASDLGKESARRRSAKKPTA
jgi:hypothetical protein